MFSFLIKDNYHCLLAGTTGAAVSGILSTVEDSIIRGLVSLLIGVLTGLLVRWLSKSIYPNT